MVGSAVRFRLGAPYFSIVINFRPNVCLCGGSTAHDFEVYSQFVWRWLVTATVGGLASSRAYGVRIGPVRCPGFGLRLFMRAPGRTRLHNFSLFLCNPG